MFKLKPGVIKAQLAVAAGIAIVCLGACSRLANIEGTWAGTPSRYETPQPAAASGSNGAVVTNISTQIATRMTFIPDQAKSGTGIVEFASDIDAVNTVPFDSTMVDPYEINIAATAVCSGTYHFDDRDEIVIAIDPVSVRVTVDPEGVNYSENVLTGQQAPQIDSLRPALVQRYTRQLIPVMNDYYSRFTRVDDIKVKNDILSCEINDRDYTFRRAR